MKTTVEHDGHYTGSAPSTTVEPNSMMSMSNSISSLFEMVELFVKESGKGRSAAEGNLYHVHLAIMTMLRAYQFRRELHEFDFMVAIEVAAAGKFDDIMYLYSSPRLGTEVLFIQAKHKENAGSQMEKDTLFPRQENSTGSYSIPMYFMSFLEVDQKLPSDVGADARYVLCTNAKPHERILAYFKTNCGQQDNFSPFVAFCGDIEATPYQFDYDAILPDCKDVVRDACLATLGNRLAWNVVYQEEIKLNDTLFYTFANLISKCVKKVEQGTSDLSASTYDLTDGFSDAVNTTSTDNSTSAVNTASSAISIAKIQKAFKTARQTLLSRQPKRNKGKITNELKIKIDWKSLTSARDTAKTGDFGEFEQKLSEFCDKFMLVCNSCNEEHLKTNANALLPKWCRNETVIDMLRGKLSRAMKSPTPERLDLKFIQNFFLESKLPDNISKLMHSSKEYQESLHRKYSDIKLHSEYLEGSKLYAFLKSERCFYRFKSIYDLNVSSCILDQTVSLFKYETLFVHSIQYVKQQDNNASLDDLLSYLTDVNHPTIKVIILLETLDNEIMIEVAELSKKYTLKIVVVEQFSKKSQNDEACDRILVKDLSKEASSSLHTQTDRLMFGTNTPLSSIVEDTDDLSYLLDLLELCDPSEKPHDQNSNELNYEKIKHWYIHRDFVPYEQVETRVTSTSIDIFKIDIETALTSNVSETEISALYDTDDRQVYILLNDAGFGKTTYFTWLAWHLSTSDPSLYVVKLNAIEFSTDFNRLLKINVQNLHDTDILKLLYRYIHLALFVPNINKRKIKETNVDRCNADRCADMLTFSNGQIELDKTRKIELSTKELVELRIFREKFNQTKLILVFDGFDEIAPYYKDVVLRCFARFARLDGVQSLYMSSRPYGFKEDLKNTFDHCRMFRLTPLSQQKIILSVNKFLEAKLNGYIHYERKHRLDILKELCGSIIGDLIDIVNVPLLLYMVLVILLDDIRTNVNERTHSISRNMLKKANLDSLHLVEYFIERKIKILATDKRGTTDSANMTAAALKEVDRTKKIIMNQHILLAMWVMFDTKNRKQLLSNKKHQQARRIMWQVNKGNEKTGLVLGVQNGVPQFLHRTFAEYFTACWLFENLSRFKRDSIFQSQTIWSESLTNTREYLDRLILRASEGCGLHLALVNESEEQIREILRNKPSPVVVANAKDKVGRYPLHLVQYNRLHIDNILRKMSPELIYEKDKLCGWSAFDYAFVLNEWDIISSLSKRGVKPNLKNLMDQVCSNDINVLLEQENAYTNHLVKYLNLTVLAEELGKHVAHHLIQDKKIEIYTPLEELNSLSVLETLITKDRVFLFRQLITESDPLALHLDDRAKRLLQLALDKKADKITTYLVEQNPSLVEMIKDNRCLLVCARSAIENNQIELFKTIFRQICIEQQIACVEEDYIIDEIIDPDEDESFEVELPFENVCCFEGFSHIREHNIDELLSVAIHCHNIQIASYILQKKNMVVTNELIETCMYQLRCEPDKNKNHRKRIPLFKFLFKKLFNQYSVRTEGLHFFRSIIKYGCVYMLHSLSVAGFTVSHINMVDRSAVFNDFLHVSSISDYGYFYEPKVKANILVYLQQRLFMECFDTFLPFGDSIFNMVITKKRFMEAQALIQDKFRNLSDLEKENGIWELLYRMWVKYEDKIVYELLQTLVRETSSAGKIENEIWNSIYSSIWNPELGKLHLVERLTDRKIVHTIQSKLTSSACTTVAVKETEDLFEIEKNRIKVQQMLLAICVKFNSKEREKLLSEDEQMRADELIEKVNQTDGTTGIILGIQNGAPQFLHTSFAEYFIACWLFENLSRFKRDSIFQSQTIWANSLAEAREYLDRLILRESEGCDLHWALVNESEERIEEILRCEPAFVHAKDSVGRFPLHLVQYQNGDYVGRIPHKMSPERIYENDELYGLNALYYAFLLNNRNLIRTLAYRGAKPNLNILSEQVCSNDINVLLEQEFQYTSHLIELFQLEAAAEELGKHVANHLIQDKKIEIYTPLEELNSLSVLETLITKDRVFLFRQLITESDPLALHLDDRAKRLLQLALDKKADKITTYLVEQHPSLVEMIKDNRCLLLCARSATENNQIELFKTIFRQICIEQQIACVEEDYIIDEIIDPDEDESFEVELPFKHNCCFESFSYKPEYNIDELLSAAILYGHLQTVSYILQKASIVVTVELIEKVVQQLQRVDYKNKNHKKCIPLLKYLFKKMLDLYDVDREGLHLFRWIIKYGCVYMLHSLIDTGFDPKSINMVNLWDDFDHILDHWNEWYTSNVLVYLQQRSYVNCFDNFSSTGESIFDTVINKKRYIVAQALIEDKFRNLSNSGKGNAFMDLLCRIMSKHGREVVYELKESLLKDSSGGSEMENEIWRSIYKSSIDNLEPDYVTVIE